MKNECLWGVDIEFKMSMRKVKSLLKQTTPLQICIAPFLNSPEYFFEFRGRNQVCFGIAYNFDWGRHMQIRAGSREGTHAHCVFHACLATLPIL